MLSPELAQIYPRLAADGGKEKSPKTSKYNCVAWAAAWDKNNWWQPDTFEPGMYWPKGVRDDGSIECFIELFEKLKYKQISKTDVGLDVFYEKVAIYENILGFTHVARQKSSGIWWSKLGEDEDIYHNTPSGLEGARYGSPNYVLRRDCNVLEILMRLFFKFASIFKKRANMI
jgi:hypothetical protein